MYLIRVSGGQLLGPTLWFGHYLLRLTQNIDLRTSQVRSEISLQIVKTIDRKPPLKIKLSYIYDLDFILDIRRLTGEHGGINSRTFVSYQPIVVTMKIKLSIDALRIELNLYATIVWFDPEVDILHYIYYSANSDVVAGFNILKKRSECVKVFQTIADVVIKFRLYCPLVATLFKKLLVKYQY
ncbi:hypothetical protein BC833DRAFT_661399 [Globomyces pollinis-pini]|nr:hypothetical protein BC833DRAFT_661399 [Globomyces pollinis-pini]